MDKLYLMLLIIEQKEKSEKESHLLEVVSLNRKKEMGFIVFCKVNIHPKFSEEIIASGHPWKYIKRYVLLQFFLYFFEVIELICLIIKFTIFYKD